MTQTIHAIDISHWQVVTSFANIKASGVIGVFNKCTEGTTYVDATYDPRLLQARAAGLKWGAYHYLKHGLVQQQMQHFLGHIKLPAGSRVAIDYEDGNCTLDDLQQALAVLSGLDPSLQIAVYAGGLLKGQVKHDQKYPWLEPYPLWLAQYTTGTPSWPTNIWPAWSLWQFSSKGAVPGIKGDCDVNTFNGSAENCAAWFGPVGSQTPSPPPPPPVDRVMIDIQTPPGVDVLVTVNGIAQGASPKMNAGEDNISTPPQTTDGPKT